MQRQLASLLYGISVIICNPTIAEEPQVQIESLGANAIRKGSQLLGALELLKLNDIEYEEIFTASAPRDPNNQMKEFLIRPETRNRDAVIIVAESPIDKEDYKVTQICWHLDWQDDVEYPYALRGNRILYLVSLQPKVLLSIPREIVKQRKDYVPPDPDDDPFGDL